MGPTRCLQTAVYTVTAAAPTDIAGLYQNLDHSGENFRLVELQPGGGDEKLVCNLVHTTFSQTPRYRALSYHWGSGDAEWTININGSPLPVHANVWHALHHLRHPTDPQTLWIDAICIYQKDKKEKNHQVPLMNQIYRRAKEVLIWLGPHEWNPSLDMKALPNRISKNEDLRANAWRQLEPWIWKSVHNEYWKRAWIVQEVGAADRIMVCCGGGSMMPWEDFITVVTAYRNRLEDDNSIGRILRLDQMRLSMYREGYSLSGLIREFQDCFCENPRDKIYAFVGLSGDHFNNSLPLDYRKPIPEVYEDFMRSLDPSDETPTTKAMEIVYMSALIRRVLTREAGRAVESDRIFEDPDEKKAELERERKKERKREKEREREQEREREKRQREEESGKHDEGTLSIVWSRLSWPEILALTAIAGAAAALVYVLPSLNSPSESKIQIPTCQIAYWKPSDPENLEYWQSGRDTSDKRGRIMARGVIATRIEAIGPVVKDITSLHTTKTWNKAVNQRFMDTIIKRRATALNDRLLAILHGELATEKIRNVLSISPNTSGGTVQLPPDHIYSQRLCVGSDLTLGVVPSTAEVGDFIVQFWNSSASAVVRREGLRPKYQIIGRSAIVKEGNANNFDVPLEREPFYATASRKVGGTIDLQMDIENLTQLSLDTVNLPLVF